MACLTHASCVRRPVFAPHLPVAFTMKQLNRERTPLSRGACMTGMNHESISVCQAPL